MPITEVGKCITLRVQPSALLAFRSLPWGCSCRSSPLPRHGSCRRALDPWGDGDRLTRDSRFVIGDLRSQQVDSSSRRILSISEVGMFSRGFGRRRRPGPHAVRPYEMARSALECGSSSYRFAPLLHTTIPPPPERDRATASTRKAVAAATALQGRLPQHEGRPLRTPTHKTRLLPVPPRGRFSKLGQKWPLPPTSKGRASPPERGWARESPGLPPLFEKADGARRAARV